MVPSVLFYPSVASVLFSPRPHQPSSTKVLHQFCYFHGSISPLLPKCCISSVFSLVPSALFNQSVASVMFSPRFHQSSSTKMLHQFCFIYGSISPLLPKCCIISVLSTVPSVLFFQSVASVLFSPRFHQSSSVLYVTPILTFLWFHQPSSTQVLHQCCSLHGPISPPLYYMLRQS
jgi:hypothetical protein